MARPTAPPAAQMPTSAPQQAADERDRSQPFTVTLPTGTHVGLGLAAAISIALAATRLHRRRRRAYGETWPSQAEPEPTPSPTVAKVRKAHLDTYAERGEPVPTDAGLVAQNLSAQAPDQITLGIREGREIALPLSGLSLGLEGPGSFGVVRAVVIELLAKSHRDRVKLVIPEPGVQALLSSAGSDIAELAAAVPGLTVTSSLHAAVAHLEAEVIHRARLMEATDEPDVPSLRTADPSEPLPALVLIASVPEEASPALQAIVQLGHRYSVGGLFLGPWPTGTTLRIADDGTVVNAEGAHASALTGARLFHLSTADAIDMLHTVRTAHGITEPAGADQPPFILTPGTAHPTAQLPERSKASTTLKAPPQPADPSRKERELPVQLSLLGPVRLQAAGIPITTGLRRSARELLAYLALHPDGVTREQAITALWPDHDPEAGTTAFHTANNNIRKVLRQATGLREPMFVIHAAGRYHLDPHLIDVDLWHLNVTLDQARQATTDTDRINALRPATLYTAEFATDLTHDWAEAHREHLRRTTVDALTHLANLTQANHPDQALTILEQALSHDPYSEPLHRSVMRLQARLGRPDAVRRTYQLLASRLSTLDAEPDEHTHQLLINLLRQQPPTPL